MRLQQVLGNYGVIVKETPELLNNFIQVQNTYITTFMTLGGLGMFLGIFGLVVVVIYSLMQRQNEFAIERCLGMPLKTICRIVFTEIGIISFLGLLCGSVSAFIALYPRITSTQAQVPWIYLANILLAMLLFALFTGYITTKFIARFHLLSSLRQE